MQKETIYYFFVDNGFEINIYKNKFVYICFYYE